MQVFLGLAFLTEGVLFGFHLKGSHLDVAVHTLLVLVVLATAGCCMMEPAMSSSMLVPAARVHLVIVQGAWFIQIAQILYTGTLGMFLQVFFAVDTSGSTKSHHIARRSVVFPPSLVRLGILMHTLVLRAVALLAFVSKYAHPLQLGQCSPLIGASPISLDHDRGSGAGCTPQLPNALGHDGPDAVGHHECHVYYVFVPDGWQPATQTMLRGTRTTMAA